VPQSVATSEPLIRLGCFLGVLLVVVFWEWLAPRRPQVAAEGWRFVALMRLVPLVPFNLLNYALGLTRISLPAYVIASAICMLPGAVAYAWLGYAGRTAAAGDAMALRYGLLGLGVLATIALLPRLFRRFRGTETT
jgi:uncharacterized membrane protein YdjX (TVP38/TMEM64 family)